MTGVVINSNIASLQAQRTLGKTTSSLADVFERLSSGYRINKASDDAAGLGIAMGLDTKTRVYQQGVRNLNDGISVFNIADGALGELSTIVIRLKELAEQSANGTFSAAQRKALDTEGQALADEYFRIARTTTFNGQKLFDGTIQGLNLQAGYGTDGVLRSSLGGKLGSGTFQTAISNGTGTVPRSVAIGDLNGDGIMDLVTANSGSASASVLLGNGDGTFRVKSDYTTGSTPRTVALGDVNGDGRLDIVTANYNGPSVSVLLGTGDGSFSAKTDYTTGSLTISVALGDVNGDGALDIVTANYGAASTSVLLGNSNGTFRAKADFTVGSNPTSVALGDVNSDGVLDIVMANYSGANLSVLIGNGNGSFRAKVDYTTPANTTAIALGDLNGDGILDIAAPNLGSTTSVFLGNSNGSFRAATAYTIGSSSYSVALGDLNGDGALDITTANNVGTGVSVALGNGDGSFRAKSDFTAGAGTFSLALGDLNRDGVLDIATANNASASALLATTRDGVAPLLEFSLKTRADALQAMSIFEDALNNLAFQRSTIGANQSRVDVASNVLGVSAEKFIGAESRIRDADIAEESSNLMMLKILQQASASVLSQANQQPSLALMLLGQ